MPLFEIAFVSQPSVKAQEAGEQEKIIAGPVTLVARESVSAVAVAGAKFAKEIQTVDASNIKVLVRGFPS